MKMRKTAMAAMVSAALLLGGTSAAMAYGNQDCGTQGKGDHQGPMRMLNRLDDLTDAQREQIRVLMEERRDGMQGMKNTMREQRQVMREAIERGATQEELRMLADQQAAHMSTMILSRAETAQRVRGILTETQREQLQELRQQRMEQPAGKKGMYRQ